MSSPEHRSGQSVVQLPPTGGDPPQVVQHEQAPPWQAPPGIAEAAKESMVGALVADTKVADQPVEYPEGCPELRPLHFLEGEDRAQAMEILGEVQEIQKKSGGSVKEGAELRAADAAGFYRMIGAIDRYLLRAAVDKDAWKAWPGRLEQDTIIQAFNAFQNGTQPGEASSSPS